MNPNLPFIDPAKLHAISKVTLYSAMYSNEKLLQEKIDEEGCGAVFAELKHGMRIWRE